MGKNEIQHTWRTHAETLYPGNKQASEARSNNEGCHHGAWENAFAGASFGNSLERFPKCRVIPAGCHSEKMLASARAKRILEVTSPYIVTRGTGVALAAVGIW